MTAVPVRLRRAARVMFWVIVAAVALGVSGELLDVVRAVPVAAVGVGGMAVCVGLLWLIPGLDRASCRVTAVGTALVLVSTLALLPPQPTGVRIALAAVVVLGGVAMLWGTVQLVVSMRKNHVP